MKKKNMKSRYWGTNNIKSISTLSGDSNSNWMTSTTDRKCCKPTRMPDEVNSTDLIQFCLRFTQRKDIVEKLTQELNMYSLNLGITIDWVM